MADEHPFTALFENIGRNPAATAERVNRGAFQALGKTLSVPVEHQGRFILLKAPRAGHGKTHLLSRVGHHLAATHEFVPLHAAEGSRIDAGSVTDDVLRRLVRPLPASGGLCVLDLIVRRLLAEALQPLVQSGEVPCQDREGALAALRTRPVETFDFHHANAVTAHWTRENFEVLGPRLSLELAQRSGLPSREVAFWVDALFRFAAAPVEQPGRAAALAQAAFSGVAGDSLSLERLSALLGLLTQLMRVVLVADDLEGFSSDGGAALRLAAFFAALRQSVERVDVILSVNQDVWENAFLPRLSAGLADRLSEVSIELDPLGREEMVALLESRVPGLGERVLEHVDVRKAGTHARGVLRAAGEAWLKAAREHAPDPVAARENPQTNPEAAPPVPPRAEPAPLVPEPDLPGQPAPAANAPDAVKEPAPFDPAKWLPETLDEPFVKTDLSGQAPHAPPQEPPYATPGPESSDPATHGRSAMAPSEPVPAREPDRVDDLLRQFRERYGRTGL